MVSVAKQLLLHVDGKTGTRNATVIISIYVNITRITNNVSIGSMIVIRAALIGFTTYNLSRRGRNGWAV